MKNILFFLVFFFNAASAQVIGAHLGSYHDPDPGNLANNVNPGAYIRFDNGLTAGAYKNSLKRDSAYIGYTSQEWGRVSVTAGIVSGYRTETVIPFAIFTVRAVTFRVSDDWDFSLVDNPKTKGAISVRIGWIPKIEEKGTNVIHLMIERAF